MNVRDSYDAAADAYAAHLVTELDGKPLDRHLLNRFGEEMLGRGRVIDLGCGPGHVARYLHDQGVSVRGVDLSPGMIRTAQRFNPGLEFQVGDMLALALPPTSAAGVVAFYSIVHFEVVQLPLAMQQMRRILAPGGLALVSFHIGDQIVHVEDLFGVRVELTFRFHRVSDVVAAMTASQLDVIEQVERQPYAGAEYQSRRGYLLARAV